MAFEVLQDGATIHKVTSRGGASKNGSPALVTTSVVCLKGEIIEEKDISPFIIKLYEEGDERIHSLLKRKEEKKAAAPKKKPAAKKTTAK